MRQQCSQHQTVQPATATTIYNTQQDSECRSRWNIRLKPDLRHPLPLELCVCNQISFPVSWTRIFRCGVKSRAVWRKAVPGDAPVVSQHGDIAVKHTDIAAGIHLVFAGYLSIICCFWIVSIYRSATALKPPTRFIFFIISMLPHKIIQYVIINNHADSRRYRCENDGRRLSTASANQINMSAGTAIK